MAENLVGDIIPKCIGDISILIIDNDTTSSVSLASMLEQFSYKVMSVNAASVAVSMIEKEESIKLVIANIEMPEIDSPSFLSALLHKDIPLILMTPEIETKKTSDMLTKGACFCLKKPIGEKDIQNMFQHVLTKKSQELEEINESESQESVVDQETKQIEAFTENLKKQRTSQASLLRRRPFIQKFTTSETYRKRRNVANVESNTKPVLCPIEIEKRKVEGNVGRRCNLWNQERHMKFLAAISILGEKDCRPKSILRIMNDPNLTHRQVASHLQKYKAQVDRLSTLPRNEWRSSTDKTFKYPLDYEFPFKASNLKKFIISSHSAWYSLRKKNTSSTSIVQYSFQKPADERKMERPKFHLGRKLDLSNHSLFGNVLNKSPMEVNYVPLATSNNPPYNIPSIHDVDRTGLVSTGLTSDNLPVLSGLPSSVDAFQMGSSMIPTPQSNPNPNPFLETDLDPIPIPDVYVPQADLNTMGGSFNLLPDKTINPLETNMNQLMDWFPSTEFNMNASVFPETDISINAPQTSTNQMDWVSSGEGYVPSANMIPSETSINQMGRVSLGESYVLPQDMIFHETNTTPVSFVSCEMSYQISPETNINQMDWVSSQESYDLSLETNVGSLPCETSYAAFGTVIASGTNIEETGLVPYDEGSDVSIEDMICYDTDVNDKDLQSWLECYDSSERNIPLPPSYLGYDTPMDSIPPITTDGTTSQPHKMMESCENQNTAVVNQTESMAGGDNFHADRDCMEWIDQILNKGA